MKKMTKLHFILIAILVAVVAAGVFFTFSSNKAEAQQPDMMNEINMALMRLETAKQENDPTDLQEQLAESQKTLNLLTRDEPLFPKEPLLVEIGSLIVDARHKLNLTLLKVKSDEDAGTITIENPDEESEDNKYSRAEFEIEVKGDLGRIVSFIGEIEGSTVTTLVIEDLELEYYPADEVDEEYIPAYWIGTFNIVTLYEYQED